MGCDSKECGCKSDNVKGKAPCGEWENCDGCNVMDNPLLFIGQAGVCFLAIIFTISLLVL